MLRPGLGTFCGAWLFRRVCGVRLSRLCIEIAPGHRKDVRVTRAELTGELTPVAAFRAHMVRTVCGGIP